MIYHFLRINWKYLSERKQLTITITETFWIRRKIQSEDRTLLIFFSTYWCHPWRYLLLYFKKPFSFLGYTVMLTFNQLNSFSIKVMKNNERIAIFKNVLKSSILGLKDILALFPAFSWRGWLNYTCRFCRYSMENNSPESRTINNQSSVVVERLTLWSADNGSGCNELPLTIMDLDHLQIPWVGSRGCLPRNANAPDSRAGVFQQIPYHARGLPVGVPGVDPPGWPLIPA